MSGLFDLRALPIKNKTLKLTWSDTVYNFHPNVVYNIKYRNDNKFVYINTTNRMYDVEHLKPGRSYTFYIKRDNQVDFPKEQTVANRTRVEGTLTFYFTMGSEARGLLWDLRAAGW